MERKPEEREEVSIRIPKPLREEIVRKPRPLACFEHLFRPADGLQDADLSRSLNKIGKHGLDDQKNSASKAMRKR